MEGTIYCIQFYLHCSPVAAFVVITNIYNLVNILNSVIGFLALTASVVLTLIETQQGRALARKHNRLSQEDIDRKSREEQGIIDINEYRVRKDLRGL